MIEMVVHSVGTKKKSFDTRGENIPRAVELMGSGKAKMFGDAADSLN